MSLRVYSNGARLRRSIGAYALDFNDHYGVYWLQCEYRKLRRCGIPAETARYALWSAAWMGTEYRAKCIDRPDRAEAR